MSCTFLSESSATKSARLPATIAPVTLSIPNSRAGLLAAINDAGVFDLDGVRLSYGPGDNQGMDDVYFTVIQSDGSFKAVDRLNSADLRWQVDAPKRRLESTK